MLMYVNTQTKSGQEQKAYYDVKSFSEAMELKRVYEKQPVNGYIMILGNNDELMYSYELTGGY